MWRLLLARPDAVPTARHAVTELDLTGEYAPLVELLTSELVSNAVVHGARDEAESILVHASTDGVVRVEVCDEGAGGDDLAAREVDLLDSEGRGLMLVDALSTRWGTSGGEPRCVWFEVDSE